MPRAKKKGVGDTHVDPAAPGETSPDQELPRGDAYEPPAASAAEVAFPPPDHNAGKQWTSKIPNTQGAGHIDLGGGRTARLIRNNQFQQMQIVISAKEGVDPRPSKDDTQYLKDNGFRWRGGDKAWRV